MSDDELTFTDLRAANLARLPLFGHGGIETGWNEAEWGCALAGEVGELCNLLKKFIRQMPGDPHKSTLIVEAARELADVVIYADLVAARLNVNLATAVRQKWNATSQKHGMNAYL